MKINDGTTWIERHPEHGLCAVSDYVCYCEPELRRLWYPIARILRSPERPPCDEDFDGHTVEDFHGNLYDPATGALFLLPNGGSTLWVRCESYKLDPPKRGAQWRDGQWQIERKGRRVDVGYGRPGDVTVEVRA